MVYKPHLAIGEPRIWTRYLAVFASLQVLASSSTLEKNNTSLYRTTFQGLTKKVKDFSRITTEFKDF